MKFFIWYIGTKKKKEKTKTPSLAVDCFSLNLRARDNSFFGMNTIISLAYINLLLKLQQNNLSDPEAYPEPCQTSKMDCFVKIVNGLNLLTFFVRH